MIKKYKYEILIFLLAFLIRVPYLGHDSFNTDSWKWKTRTYNFSNGVFGGNFDLTLQMYHPGVTLMWLGTAGIKTYNLYYDVLYGGEPASDRLMTVFGLNAAVKYFVILAISFASAFIFYALRRLFGITFAVVSIVMLLLEPFYLGLTREFHLEGLMSTFMLASVLLAYYFFKHKDATRLVFVISAVFAALAILTKVTAIFVVPFILAFYAFYVYQSEKNLRSTLAKVWKTSLLWLGVLVLSTLMLWPALWVSPLAVFSLIYNGIFNIGVEGGHEQLYFGKYVADPGISFYFVSLFYRSSVFLIPGVLGYFVWARKKADKVVKDYVIYLLAFSFFYLIPMLVSSKKLDRYMLPTLMGLSLLSSIFYYYLLRSFAWAKYVGGVIITVWLMYLAFLTPDYLVYYSPYGGGISKGIYVIEPKWVIGSQDLKAYLHNDIAQNQRTPFTEDFPFRKLKPKNEFMDDMLVVGLPEKYFTQLYPFVMESGAWPVIATLTDDARKADYFIFPVWEDTWQKINRFDLEYVDSIYMSGVFKDTKVFNVYRNLGE